MNARRMLMVVLVTIAVYTASTGVVLAYGESEILELRGSVEDSGAIGAMTWTANNWAALYFDINDPFTATETLAYADVVGSANPAIGVAPTNNVMDKGELTYTTFDAAKAYKVASETAATNLDILTGYSVMGWMGEIYVPVDGDAQKITRLVLEQDSVDKMTLKVGESWDLGNGYTLTPEQIDVDGNKVWLTLKKDGVVIEDGIVDTKDGTTAATIDTGKTFVAKADFAGKTDAVYFVTYVDGVFNGTVDDLVQLKYTWLIDKTDVTSIATDDTFGNFKCTLATSYLIMLSNDNAITLNMDSRVPLLSDVYFKVSEAGKGTGGGYLFYPATEVITPGTYEVRGTVEDSGAIGAMSWTATNWPALNFDINAPATATETLAYVDDGVSVNPAIGASPFNNVMDKDELTYTTGDVAIPYEVVTNVAGITKVTNYAVMGWMGEKYVAIEGDAQKITRLVLEQDANDTITLGTGEAWDLGNGYTLTPQQIDVDGYKVSVVLKKDGIQIEDEILDTTAGAASDDRTFVATADFAGKTDAVYFVTYVESINKTEDHVQFKYTWLIDRDDITTISTDDTFGNFRCTGASSNLIVLSNDNAIILNMDDRVPFMEDMYFKVSKAYTGTDLGYLFYPARDIVVSNDMDRTAPTLIITSPTSGTIVTTPVITVTGTASDDTGVASVTVNGVLAEGNTSWSKTIPLAKGPNTIEVVATDTSGNTAVKTVTVTYMMQIDKLELRGSVEDSGAIGAMTWTATNWPAFYFDINGPFTATERLAYADVVGSANPAIGAAPANNVIDKGELTYTTGDVPVQYKVFTACPTITTVTNYAVMGWMGEKYVAIDSDAQQITRRVLEQDAGDKKTLRVNESWNLGNGYTLVAQQIDVDGNKVWLTLEKDGVLIEDEVLDTSTIADSRTFVAKADFAGKTDAVYFVTYVDGVFKGTVDDIVQLKYTWLIDKTDVTAIATGDTFGNFKCTVASSNLITLSNDNAITLNMDSRVPFLGGVYFRVSEAGKGTGVGSYLFYPATEITEPGTYEVRGSVEDTGAIGAMSWTATNWPALNFDINDPATATESLAYVDDVVSANPAIGASPLNNVMDKGELTYTTADVPKTYKVASETASTSVTSYSVMGWLGEKYVAIEGDAQKITRLVFEQDANDTKTLGTGESWDLANGYTLTPQQIDVDGNKVLVVLKKDGLQIEDEVLDISNADGRTFVATADFAGKTDAVYFVTYVESINKTEDHVQFKYTWLIDRNDITTISIDDTFGNFKCTGVSSNLITLSNDNAITLNLDDRIPFLVDMYFKVSKAGKGSLGVEYLFYPAREIVVSDVGIKGDLNGNSILDTGDATLALRMVVGLTPPDLLGDMNDNGGIDTGDATLILRKVVGLD